MALFSRHAFSVGAALVVGLPASVMAQEAEPDTVEAAPIEVRVTRQPLLLSRVPRAVSVKEPGILATAAPGLGLDDALRGIAGVQVDQRFNEALGERISIRGFGARAQFGVRGVHVVYDGIPATLPDGQTTLSQVQPATIAAVEVLRGPGSAIWGNASGGVLRLESRGPPASGRLESVELAGGAFGRIRTTATTAGRTGATGWRFDLSRVAWDGFREHSDSETWHLTGRMDRAAGGGELSLAVHGVAYEADNPGSLSADQLAEDRTAAHPFNVVQGTGEEAGHLEAGLSWWRPLGSGRLILSGYAIDRSVENPIPPAIIDLDRFAGGVRLGYRGVRPLAAGPLLWSVGVEADLQADDRVNFENASGERGRVALAQDERVRAVAPWARVSWPVTRRVAVLGGIRWDRIDFEAEDRLVGPDDPDDSGSRTLEAWSPSLGVTVDLGRFTTLFANLATAFETPTTSELANRPDGAGGFHPTLEPQRTRSVEAGLRTSPVRWGRLELAAWRADVDDILVPFEIADQPGRQFFRNAGEAVHEGMEVEAMAAGGPAALRLAYTWTAARFAGGGLGPEDARIPGVAPHRVEALGSLVRGGWSLEVAGRWIDEVPANDANTAAAPSYGVVDLAGAGPPIGFGPAEARIRAGVTNLLDEAYVSSVVVNAFGDRFFEPGPGRSAWVGMEVRWRRPR